jgi:hypothetical protein
VNPYYDVIMSSCQRRMTPSLCTRRNSPRWRDYRWRPEGRRQLPTEDSLIARFGVSRITVRRAMQNLVSRGLVEIRRRKAHSSPHQRSRRTLKS